MNGSILILALIFFIQVKNILDILIEKLTSIKYPKMKFWNEFYLDRLLYLNKENIIIQIPILITSKNIIKGIRNLKDTLPQDLEWHTQMKDWRDKTWESDHGLLWKWMCIPIRDEQDNFFVVLIRIILFWQMNVLAIY